MNDIITTALRTVLLCCLLLGPPAFAGPPAKLQLPDFAALRDKASDSVDIELDSSLLTLAGRFLDANDPRDAAAKEVIQGLQGIYVRSFTFDADSAYQEADLKGIRSQLSAPGWTRLVQTRSRKTRANVEIFVMLADNKAVGLALIASEPREFTIVNIIGAIDLEKLRKLEGQFGIPSLDGSGSKP